VPIVDRIVTTNLLGWVETNIMIPKVILKELKSSRGNPSDFLMNFIFNYSRASTLMHKCLVVMLKEKYKQNLMKEASRNYIISMASCLETFYRDMFIHILKQDKSLLSDVLTDIKEKKTLSEVHELSKEDIDLSELAAYHFKFQNVEEIERSMVKLFEPKGYLKSVNDYEHICTFFSSGLEIKKIVLPKKWQRDLSHIFQNRHKLIHDASSKFSIPLNEMAHLETLVLAITQISAAIVAEKFNVNLLRISKKGEEIKPGTPPLFLTIEDITREDWEPYYGN
jgi:hypothetical protein